MCFEGVPYLAKKTHTHKTCWKTFAKPKRTELLYYRGLLYDGSLPLSDSLNCVVCLPLQLVGEQQESRPLLSPSIDDFLCETKCDGVSRPVTSNTAGTVHHISTIEKRHRYYKSIKTAHCPNNHMEYSFPITCCVCERVRDLDDSSDAVDMVIIPGRVLYI